MDYLIYNLTGYKTHNHLENCANIIQRAYRNHKSYEINKRIDIIKNKRKENIKILDKEDEEEMDYWKYLREKVKCEAISLKSLGWVYT